MAIEGNALKKRLLNLLMAGLWLVCTPLLWPGLPGMSSEAHAYDLKIGTHTSLTCKISQSGTLLTVDGFLRDNVEQGIGGEIVTVYFERRVDSNGFVARDVRTDRTGRFYASFRLGTGIYDGKITYSGREFYYAPSAFEVSDLKSERGKLDLKVTLPELALQTPQGVQGVLFASSSAQPVPKLKATLQVQGEDISLITGPRGKAVFSVSTEYVTTPRVPVNVFFDGSSEYKAASARGVIRVLQEPELRLEADNVRARLERGVRVRGELEDKHGPVQANVDLFLKQKGVEVGRFRARTDEEGAFQIFVSEKKLAQGALEVQGRVLVGKVPVEAEPFFLKVETTGTGLLPWFLGALLFLFGGFYLGKLALEWWKLYQKRNPGKKKPRRRSLERAQRPPIVPVEEFSGEVLAPVSRDGILGILRDRQTEKVIQGAEVSVLEEAVYPEEIPSLPSRVSDAKGRFSFEDIPPGTYVLRVRARGYITASHRFAIPHDGRLGRFQFPLTPVRVVVRDIYDELAEDITRQDAVWGRLTPRQVQNMMMAVLRETRDANPDVLHEEGHEAFKRTLSRVLLATKSGNGLSPTETVSSVVGVMEEVYYSQRLHDEALAEIMERLARHLRKAGAEERA